VTPSASRQRVVLPATLLSTMTAGVFQLFLFAVLAAPLIDDIGLTRTEIGVLGSINTLVGALSSPYTGRLTDRLGAKRAVVSCLAISATGMALLAAAPGLGWMYVAAAVGGLPQGWTNPATNGLIATRVAPGRRGTVTGIKQSGVTLGAFLAGVTLPALENGLGWRGATWVYAALFAAMAAAVQLGLTSDASEHHVARSASDVAQPIAPMIWWLAVYAFFMGLASGAVGRFLPLFAEESLGFSTETAGLIAALGGLLGMFARIVAARVAEHRVAPTRLLTILSLVGMMFCLLLAAITESTRWLLWLSPPLNAIGTNAWNAVAMLAIIMFVSTSAAGRASGRVMLGFLGGLALSGPLTGWVVDRTDDYRPVWIASALVSAIAAALMLATHRRQGTARAMMSP
jgi:sugar phosphate permease